MQWVRLDTAVPRNHKIVELTSTTAGYRSAFAWVCALAYAGEQETDGFIPRSALKIIGATPRDVERLVEVRLFIPDEGGGGWWLNDWTEYQPTSDVMRQRSINAKNAAAVRWGNQPKRDP